jgi:hypothetical protein
MSFARRIVWFGSMRTSIVVKRSDFSAMLPAPKRLPVGAWRPFYWQNELKPGTTFARG